MKESRQKMVEELNKKILEEKEYKSLKEIGNAMPNDQKRILFINNSIDMVANAESKFPLMVNWHLHGTTYDVSVGVHRSFGEYYFMIGLRREHTERFILCYLKSGTREEIIEYMQQWECREEADRSIDKIMDCFEEASQKIENRMAMEQKLQFCIPKAREAFISRFPEIEFGVIFPIPGTTRDVTMWVGKREVEVEQEETKKKWKLLKRWEKQKSAEKKERHYFRVSVQDIDTDVLVSSFLIFGTREEIMEYIKKEDVEKEILEQIMELSKSVDE